MEVMTAKRVSDIPAPLEWGSRDVCVPGVGVRRVGVVFFVGRHLSTLSALARAGWHCKG